LALGARAGLAVADRAFAPCFPHALHALFLSLPPFWCNGRVLASRRPQEVVGLCVVASLRRRVPSLRVGCVSARCLRGKLRGELCVASCVLGSCVLRGVPSCATDVERQSLAVVAPGD
jgi:hypothetical protein